MTTAQRRALLAVGCLLYICGLHLAYVLVLSPLYRAVNFVYDPPGPATLVIVWCFALLPCLWLPVLLRRASQVVYWLLYLMAFVPSSVVPLYSLNLPIEKLML